ncbi:MAG: hypothetical protein ACTSR1_00495 [Candidatus Heimdallarchaeota archaeon]
MSNNQQILIETIAYNKVIIVLEYFLNKNDDKIPKYQSKVSSIFYDNKDLAQLLGESFFNLLNKKISNPDFKNLVKEICSNICEATYQFTNRDFRIRSQHLLFEKIGKFPIDESLTEYITIKFSLHKELLETILAWEDLNKNRYPEGIHKGTGYFWISEYYLDQDYLDKGFQYLAQAIDEDKRLDLQKSNYRIQGGYLAASLIDKYKTNSKIISPNSIMIKNIIIKLKEIIVDYQKKFRSSFTYEELKSCFLLDTNLEEPKFIFTRTFTQLYDFVTNYEEYLYSNFLIFPIILSNLFSLTVVYEDLIKRSSYRERSLAKSVFRIICDKLLTQSEKNIFCAASNNKTKLQADINNKFKTNWIKTHPNYISDIISLNFNSDGQRVPISASLLISAYLLRNLGAHDLAFITLSKEKVEKLHTNICCSIILIIELLHK